MITTAGKLEQLQATIETVIQASPMSSNSLWSRCSRVGTADRRRPGVGKTTLAQTLARSFDCTFQRIQFTSDMLPSDIVGLSVFNQRTQHIRVQARADLRQRDSRR